MNALPEAAGPLLRDERGVALPLVMLMAILFAVVLGSAVVTGSTETRQSAAHRDGVTAIHRADGALQWFLSRKHAGITAGTDSFFPETVRLLPPGGDSVRFTVARLSRVTHETVFSVLAEPVRGTGRSVAAMVPMHPSTSLQLGVNAATSFGGNLRTTGSGNIFGIAHKNRCKDQTPVHAVQNSLEGTFARDGSGQIQPSTDRTGESRQEMERRILGGKTARDIAANADIQFGSLYGRPAFNPLTVIESHKPRSSPYNWGCPNSLHSCGHAIADTSYYPVIAIDGNGGTVNLNEGNHGQGILVIINGHLRLGKPFKFKGLILAEGAVDLPNALTLDGAVVALNVVNIGADNRSDFGGGFGNLYFDPCVLKRVEMAYNARAPVSSGWTSMTRPFAWQEIVR